MEGSGHDIQPLLWAHANLLHPSRLHQPPITLWKPKQPAPAAQPKVCCAARRNGGPVRLLVAHQPAGPWRALLLLLLCVKRPPEKISPAREMSRLTHCDSTSSNHGPGGAHAQQLCSRRARQAACRSVCLLTFSSRQWKLYDPLKAVHHSQEIW